MRRLLLVFIALILMKGDTCLNTVVETRLTNILSTYYTDIISAAAKTYNIPAALIAAVIKAESNFNPRAVSNKGAIGLMQLTFCTRKHTKLSNPFDPVQNIRAGAKYLRELLDRFNGDMRLALAAYNAGPGAVQKHGGVPPFKQTRQYVPKVMQYYSQFQSGIAVD